jgi:hypothetical protein
LDELLQPPPMVTHRSDGWLGGWVLAVECEESYWIEVTSTRKEALRTFLSDGRLSRRARRLGVPIRMNGRRFPA